MNDFLYNYEIVLFLNSGDKYNKFPFKKEVMNPLLPIKYSAWLQC